MNLYSLIIDTIAIIVFILVIRDSAAKGFVATVVSFAGYLLSALLAGTFSNPISNYVYNTFIRVKIADLFSTSLNDIMDFSNAESILTQLTATFEDLPPPLNSLLYSNAELLQTTVTENLGETASNIAYSVTDAIITPLVTGLLQIIAFLLLFTICSLIVKGIAYFCEGLYHVPLIGKINSFLGGIVGILKGGLSLWFMQIILSLIITITGESLPFLTNEVLNQTFIIKWFMFGITL